MSSNQPPPDEVAPATVEIPQMVLDDLRQRLANTRWPDEIEGSDWTYGTDLAYLQSLCESWQHFDWRSVEARLNVWPQIVTTIDGQRIHAIHARSPEPNAMPLIITHGWPGSVVEFLDVIEPLRDPRSHGGDPADAFHIIAPSIPGYGFSGPTHESGWDVRRVAEAWAVLMARLGYDRYGAQGGDWGSMISSQIGVVDAEHLAGIHINMVLGIPDDTALSADDQALIDQTGAFMNAGTAYQQIQGKNPQTLGYGLSDSPAGLAGWITEKFHHWTHHPDGDLETAITREQLLANLTLYWVTGTINSSIRLYFESQQSGRFPPFERVEVPTGCAVFPGEIISMPQAWARNLYNVTRYTTFDRGGHFAAMEEPDLFIDDVRAFFRTVR
ncbi:MAG: epoxide hydrolase family protein [Ilumatobacteraceae bacterium]